MDKKIKTTEKTLTIADVRAAIHAGLLSDEEERYVRMKFGISEPMDAVLPRRGTEFPETRAQIALIEAALVADRIAITGDPIKDKIIDSLRKA